MLSINRGGSLRPKMAVAAIVLTTKIKKRRKRRKKRKRRRKKRNLQMRVTRKIKRRGLLLNRVESSWHLLARKSLKWKLRPSL
jgi:hypothetical protein